MPLTLTPSELEKLTAALQVLVSPLDHPSVDHWRSCVNTRLKELLGADSAGFLLPVEEGLMLYSDEHDPAELARYQDYPPPTIDGMTLWEKILIERVGTLSGFYGQNYHLYTNTPYYQEYAGANGAHDTMAAATSVGGVDARGMACMHFWHAKPNGRRFGEREIKILKLLYPAFQAGVEAQLRWGAHRSALLNTLDALGQAVMVCDLMGNTLHQTAALCELLLPDPEANDVFAAMLNAMTVVRGAVRAKRSDPSLSQPCRAASEVKTDLARYAVRASLYGSVPAGSKPVILVALERCTPVPLSEAELQASFGFTRAEVRVAQLIAQGRANAEIADELCISPHTARRHTEKILLKLHVKSRAEVAPRLLR